MALTLNVACGGTLHQELSSYYSESPNMRTIWPAKAVYLEAETLLAQALGVTKCRVNSLHKQAIDEPGRLLRVVARESNAVIQAIEHRGKAWAIGVQWHPEYLPQKLEQLALFRNLVTAARAYREERQRRKQG